MKKMYKRIIIIVVVILIVLLGVKLLLIVPIPDYLPKENNWTLLEKQSSKFIFNKHLYCRYKITGPVNEIKSSLQDAISSLHEWNNIEELSSQEIQEIVKEKIKDTELLTNERYLNFEIAKQVAPFPGWEYVIPTEKPFTVLRFQAYIESSNTSWTISVRIIENGNVSCVMELWDYQGYNF